MILADEQRRMVEVNSAFARLLRRPQKALIGHHVYEFLEGGPRLSDEEWRAALMSDEFVGEGSMKRSDGELVQVQWAAHPTLVTGRPLVLCVALSTSRAGRHFRREVQDDGEDGVLSEREHEIVRLIANGESGPEIAESLGISHNTVRTHVHNAMVKLGARSRAHLVAKALCAGPPTS
jgi:DNA-binding CsgD family transcriptional regulator